MEIKLGQGYVIPNRDEESAYLEAFHEAHDSIGKDFGETTETIYKWCEENIPNEFTFRDEKLHVIDNYDSRTFSRELTIMCRIYIKFLTEEAAMAFMLRWL